MGYLTRFPEKCTLCDFVCMAPCHQDEYTASSHVKCSNYIASKEAKMANSIDKPPTPPWEQTKQKETPRGELLLEAYEIVHKDRNANYGNPEDNFAQIAALWTAYWQAKCKSLDVSPKYTAFDSADVAVMNMLIKVARLAKNSNHHDSAVDIAGYAACLADIQEVNKAKTSAGAGSVVGSRDSATNLQQNKP